MFDSVASVGVELEVEVEVAEEVEVNEARVEKMGVGVVGVVVSWAGGSDDSWMVSVEGVACIEDAGCGGSGVDGLEGKSSPRRDEEGESMGLRALNVPKPLKLVTHSSRKEAPARGRTHLHPWCTFSVRKS